MIKKLLITITLVNFVFSTVTSQSETFTYSPQMPQVVMQSPQAAQFMRYGEIPVGTGTGIPEISIPIYTISQNGFNLPISISYHASGNKVEDVASCVGLGWVLNAGGMISQSIMGREDNPNSAVPGYEYPYKNDVEMLKAINTDISGYKTRYFNYMEYLYFPSTSPNVKNIISDRYSYSFNGESGTFRYNISTKQIETFPQSSNKVSYYRISDSDYGFKITDNKGIVWTFKYFQTTTKTDIGEYSSDLTYPVAKDYYLTRIDFPNEDCISFYYKNGKSYIMDDYSENIQFGDDLQVNYSPTVAYPEFRETGTYRRKFSYAKTVTTPVLLERIEFKNGNIEFKYSTRKDSKMKERLTSFIVKSTSNDEIIKGVLDNTMYLGSKETNYRMLLRNILINNEKYSFFYDSMELPEYKQPYNALTFVNKKPTIREDFWGYYNGENVDYLIPFRWSMNEIDHAPRSSMNNTRVYMKGREPNPKFTQAGILKSITYPTGGETNFEYEQNQKNGVFLGMGSYTNGYYGGLRIKRICAHPRSSGSIGNAFCKTYEYEGGHAVTISPDNFHYKEKRVVSAPVIGSKVVHLETKEVSPDIYVVSTAAPLYEAGAQPIYYRKVTEYNGVSDGSKTITEYTYHKNTSYPRECIDDFPGGSELNPRARSFYQNCDKGIVPVLLESKKIYEGNPQSKRLIYSEKYEYDDIYNGSSVIGVDFINLYSFSPRLIHNEFHIKYSGIYQETYKQEIIDKYRDAIVTLNRYALNSYSNIKKKIQTEYINNKDSVVKIEEYKYDLHSRVSTPVEIKYINSDGSAFIEKYEHPFNFTNSVYSGMVTKNIQSPVVKKTLYKTDYNNILKTIQYNYDEWNFPNSRDRKLYDITSVYSGNSNSTKQRIKYHKYNAYGNPVHVTMDDATTIIYLWAHLGQYPVAKIEGATYDEVKSALRNLAPEEYGVNMYDYDDSLLKGLKTNASLSKALITTYRYKPLVGIIETTDSNGITTFYNYDSSGRLVSVTDNDKKMVDRYEYHYRGEEIITPPPVVNPPSTGKDIIQFIDEVVTITGTTTARIYLKSPQKITFNMSSSGTYPKTKALLELDCKANFTIGDNNFILSPSLNNPIEIEQTLELSAGYHNVAIKLSIFPSTIPAMYGKLMITGVNQDTSIIGSDNTLYVYYEK